MARRIGPAKRTVEFAHAIAQDPRLIAAICKSVAATLPLIVEQLEAEQRQAAAPPAPEPTMLTFRERQALKNARAT